MRIDTSENDDLYRIECPNCRDYTVSFDWAFPVWGPELIKVKGRCNYCAHPLVREYELRGVRDTDTNKLLPETIPQNQEGR